MNELVAVTKVYQEGLGLSDAQFASFLGINHSTWSLLQASKRQPGVKFIRAVARHCPELKPSVDDFIYGKPKPRIVYGTKVLESPQTHRERAEGLLRRVYRGLVRRHK